MNKRGERGAVPKRRKCNKGKKNRIEEETKNRRNKDKGE